MRIISSFAMKNVLIVIAIVAAFTIGILVSQKYDFRIESKDKPNSEVVSPTISTAPTEKPLVGDDVDEYGCKPSAGYSWCESKKKCIKEFEEPCDEQEAIAQAIITKNSWRAEDVIIIVSKSTGQFARGSIREKTSEVGGGMFLAVKQGGKWEIVFEGNGAPDCLNLKKYSFPKDFLSGICD